MTETSFAHLRDCRTCKWNMYLPKITDFVDCNHPITFERHVRHQEGDPAIVNFRTADISVDEIDRLKDCPTYEASQ